MSPRFLDRLLPNVNVVRSLFWFPLNLACLQVDPMAAKKKGDLVLYFGDLYRGTQTPIVSLSETKNGFVLSGFSLNETSER